MVLSRVQALKGLFLCEPLSMDKTFKVDEDLIAFERRMEFLQDAVLSKMDLSDAPLDNEDSESEEDVGDSSISISTEDNPTADSRATPGVDNETAEVQADNFDMDDFWGEQLAADPVTLQVSPYVSEDVLTADRGYETDESFKRFLQRMKKANNMDERAEKERCANITSKSRSIWDSDSQDPSDEDNDNDKTQQVAGDDRYSYASEHDGKQRRVDHSTTDNDNSGNAETQSVTGSARSSYTSEHESKRRRIIRSHSDDVSPIWYGLGEHIGVPEDMDHFRLNNLESVADNEVSDEFQNRVFSDYPLNDTYTRRGNYISVLRFCCVNEINSRADRRNMNERRRVWSSIRSNRDLRTSIVQRAKAMYSKEFCSADQNPSE